MVFLRVDILHWFYCIMNPKQEIPNKIKICSHYWQMVAKWRSKVLQNAPLGAFCNTFDLHYAIVGLENQFVVFLRVAVLHRFYCSGKRIYQRWANSYLPYLYTSSRYTPSVSSQLVKLHILFLRLRSRCGSYSLLYHDLSLEVWHEL